MLTAEYPFVCWLWLLFRHDAITVVMGNAFARFAVFTAEIGLPLNSSNARRNPAKLWQHSGMFFAGYAEHCFTPMQQTFNIVPAMLLELKDKNAVIKAQVPIALFQIVIINMLFMYGLVLSFLIRRIKLWKHYYLTGFWFRLAEKISIQLGSDKKVHEKTIGEYKIISKTNTNCIHKSISV